MKAKTVEQNNEKITLLIEDVEVAIINGLRRAILRSVPTMAIEDVEFFKNSSPFYDEMMANRIGLIPLTTDYSYSLKKDCKCKGAGCSRCQVTLGINKKGPGYVYTSDMQTSDPKVKPVHEKMIIAYLDEDQELNFEAKAELGTGSEHAKWSPGLPSYRFYPKIVPTSKAGKNAKTIAEPCPVHAIDWSIDGKILVSKKNMEECAHCKECAKASEKEEIEIEHDRTKVFFTFESWGQLPIKTVFDKALTELDNQANEIKR